MRILVQGVQPILVDSKVDGAGEILLKISIFAGLGLATGFLSGLFGIGGGTVRIPIFIYMLPLFGVGSDVLMHMAIGTSVALVIPTAVVATRKQVRLGNLDLVYYKTWALGIFAGVLLGMWLLPYVSSHLLTILFGIFLLSVGCYVGFVKDSVVIASQAPRGAAKFAISSGVGCAAALTGTGGGALTTPVLKAFNYPLKRAIALASAGGLVVGVVSTAGVIIQGWDKPHRPSACLGYIDIWIFLGMLPTTMLATPIGATVGNAMNKVWLKRIYTVLLLVTAADIFWKWYSSG